MKNTFLTLMMSAFCLLLAQHSVAQGRNKAFTIDMSKIKQGTNLIYSDNEMKIFAKYEKGKPTVYTAQKPDGTKLNLKFERDVVAAGVASASSSSANTNRVSSGTSVSTSPHGKTVEGGNTKKPDSPAVASNNQVTCTITSMGIVCK